jgi:hypothetical protein
MMVGMRIVSLRLQNRAGISKIDYVLITHFHADHVGGVPQLESRIPIGTFIDHGDNRETTDVHHCRRVAGISKSIGDREVQTDRCQTGRHPSPSRDPRHRRKLGRRINYQPPARRGPAEFQLQQLRAIFRRSDRKLSLFGNPYSRSASCESLTWGT